ncbi:hypothetical protein BJ322DRAFT_1061677 [Thelephora terrestris]|uniref:Xylanolytic transcriptional activator regulatory domain-containing protein n=1 Tax=Thelephora terrestris TaxID=56493 RepID=A0A9P6HDU2_9AGAM|nr:hypothetical protein BJ322DRAFT_1061677 [Thelephora terrestris]
MVIYETISGNLPFHEDMGPMVIVKVLTGERPCRLVGFTDGLWEILERCWASRASERPRVEDVLECLRMCADSSVPPSSEMDAGTGGLGFYDPIPVRQGDFNSFEHDVLPAPLLSPPPFLASDTFISPNGENLHTTPPGVASGPQLHTFPEMPITGEVLLVVPLPTTQKRLRLFQGSRARAAVTPLTQEAKTLLNYAETSSEASEKWSFLLPTSTPPISNHIYLANITVHDPSPARTSYSLTLPSSVPPAPTSRKRRRSGSDLETPSGSGSQWTSDAPMRPAGLEANIVRDLVGLFFAHCHHGRMVIHKPTFMAALSQNRVASHLILAMCAMSAPFSQSPQVKSQPPRLAGIKFYEDALNTLFDSSGRLIYEANLQTVQTLCLLEMHDVVAQYSWTKCYRYLDLAAKILFEELDIASPESPPLSPKPTIEEMSRMTERECARRCYWIIYFLHVISTACTRNVRRFSTEGMLMRLPVDESSFELGIQSQTPEYLDEMAPKANYVSEFGHLIRITALFSQMEDAVSIVDDDDRFVSAMHEATTALKAWESSLPDHLRYTKDNLHIMSSMYETPMNTGPWCFFYMHALHSCCEMSAASETQKLFRRGEFSIPKEASDAGDRCLRILESVGSRAKNLNYLSEYFNLTPGCVALQGLTGCLPLQSPHPCGLSAGTSRKTLQCLPSTATSRPFGGGNLVKSLRSGENTTRLGNLRPVTLGRLLLVQPQKIRAEGILASGSPLRSSSSAIIRADDKDDFHQPSSITSRYPGDSEWRTLPSLRSVGLLDSFDNRRTNSNPGSALPPLSKAREW